MLVFRTGCLGDTLVALPAISIIRSRFPAHRLVLLTNRDITAVDRVSSWSVLSETGWFDSVYFYEPGLRSLAGAWRTLCAALKLRSERFDYVFNLAGQRTSFQLMRDRLLLRFLLGANHYHAETRPHDRSREHGFSQPRVVSETLRLAEIVQPHSLDPGQVGFQLSIPSRERDAAERLLAGIGIARNQPLLAVGPATRMPAKDWPEDRYRALGAALLERHDNLMLVVIGDTKGRILGERLCAAWGPRSRNLAGRLSVYGSGAVLTRCVAYVGNDSGAMHLAAMAGTPCIAIFSAREAPGRWEPFGKRHIVLRQDTDCAGCMLEVCAQEEKKCLTRITVDSVLAATATIIRESSQSRRSHHAPIRTTPGLRRMAN